MTGCHFRVDGVETRAQLTASCEHGKGFKSPNAGYMSRVPDTETRHRETRPANPPSIKLICTTPDQCILWEHTFPVSRPQEQYHAHNGESSVP